MEKQPLLSIQSLLPAAISWAEQAEQEILVTGIPLVAPFLDDARAIGVKDTGKIRLLRVHKIPAPVDPILRQANEKVRLISLDTGGLTLRYGIYIRSDCWNRRQLIAHELVHVIQYERLGGFEPFPRKYLDEVFTEGYGPGALEQEAIRIAANYA